MKKLYRFIVLAVCVCMMASCGKKSEIVVSDLAQAIAGGVAFSEPLTEIDSSAAERLLYLNPNDYSEIAMYIGTEATCDEFVIISSSNTKSITEKLTSYLANVKSAYAAYRPNEAAKTDNAFITEYNGTVVMVVCSDPENAQKVYEEYLKK